MEKMLQILIILISGILLACFAQIPPFIPILDGGAETQAQGVVTGSSIANSSASGSSFGFVFSNSFLTVSTEGTAANVTDTTANAGYQNGTATIISDATADSDAGQTFIDGFMFVDSEGAGSTSQLNIND